MTDVQPTAEIIMANAGQDGNATTTAQFVTLLTASIAVRVSSNGKIAKKMMIAPIAGKLGIHKTETRRG